MLLRKNTGLQPLSFHWDILLRLGSCRTWSFDACIEVAKCRRDALHGRTQVELHDEHVQSVKDAHAQRLGGPELFCSGKVRAGAGKSSNVQGENPSRVAHNNGTRHGVADYA